MTHFRIVTVERRTTTRYIVAAKYPSDLAPDSLSTDAAGKLCPHYPDTQIISETKPETNTRLTVAPWDFTEPNGKTPLTTTPTRPIGT